MVVMVGWMFKGLLLQLTPWMLRQMCCEDKSSLPQLVMQCWGVQVSTTKVYHNAEKMGWLVWLTGCTNNVFSVPKIAAFLSYFGKWPTQLNSWAVYSIPGYIVDASVAYILADFPH